MPGFVRHLVNRDLCRMLPYIDDFLVAICSPDIEEDGAKARAILKDLFDRLWPMRKTGKGCWEGSRALDNLRIHIITVAMSVFVVELKFLRVHQLCKKLLLLSQWNRRLINGDLNENFYSVGLSSVRPIARFYTRSQYFDISRAKLGERGKIPQHGQSVARISRVEDVFFATCVSSSS